MSSVLSRGSMTPGPLTLRAPRPQLCLCFPSYAVHLCVGPPRLCSPSPAVPSSTLSLIIRVKVTLGRQSTSGFVFGIIISTHIFSLKKVLKKTWSQSWVKDLIFSVISNNLVWNLLSLLVESLMSEKKVSAEDLWKRHTSAWCGAWLIIHVRKDNALRSR